jgi:nucleoid-associated protein YgaU
MNRLTLWLASLAAGLWALHHLPVPADAQPAAVVPAFAAIRLLALGLGWYLLVSTVVGLGLRVARMGAAVRLVDLVTLPVIRSVLNRAAGISLAAALTFASPLAAAAVSPAVAAAAPADAPVAGPPVMHLLDDAPPPPAPAAPQAAPTWSVKAGENLWQISRAVLTDHLQRRPTNAEVVPYWHALMALNRDVAPDPNLIFVGQQLRLPPT